MRMNSAGCTTATFTRFTATTWMSARPAITLRKGDERTDATLWTWHEERDLALLIVNKGSLPRVKWAAADETPQYGERIMCARPPRPAGSAAPLKMEKDSTASAIGAMISTDTIECKTPNYGKPEPGFEIKSSLLKIGRACVIVYV